MSRFELLTDAQWSLIEDLLPTRTGKRGRPFQEARSMVSRALFTGTGAASPGETCPRCSDRGRRSGPGIEE